VIGFGFGFVGGEQLWFGAKPTLPPREGVMQQFVFLFTQVEQGGYSLDEVNRLG